MSIRRFNLIRKDDLTGISGVGIIAEGAEYSNGSVALTWLTPHWSGAWFISIHEVKHIHGHNGKTKVVWIDPPTIDDIEEIIENNLDRKGQKNDNKR